jgi:hypothetical protein
MAVSKKKKKVVKVVKEVKPEELELKQASPLDNAKCKAWDLLAALDERAKHDASWRVQPLVEQAKAELKEALKEL